MKMLLIGFLLVLVGCQHGPVTPEGRAREARELVEMYNRAFVRGPGRPVRSTSLCVLRPDGLCERYD